MLLVENIGIQKSIKKKKAKLNYLDTDCKIYVHVYLKIENTLYFISFHFNSIL